MAPAWASESREVRASPTSSRLPLTQDVHPYGLVASRLPEEVCDVKAGRECFGESATGDLAPPHCLLGVLLLHAVDVRWNLDQCLRAGKRFFQWKFARPTFGVRDDKRRRLGVGFVSDELSLQPSLHAVTVQNPCHPQSIGTDAVQHARRLVAVEVDFVRVTHDA